MKQKNVELQGEKALLRLIEKSDKDKYYAMGFETVDEQSMYLTGTTGTFSREAIERYVDRIVEDETRYDFLIVDRQSGEMVGEAVLNEIDWDSRCAGFRIALFQSQEFNRGFGSEATALTLRFAFEGLGLHRVELEVFDYNPRARHVYEKAGFRQEGVKRDGLWMSGQYHDVILMGVLESDYASRAADTFVTAPV